MTTGYTTDDSEELTQRLGEHTVEQSMENMEQEDAMDGECFDPLTCCDRHEQLMIAMMREYLRPQAAPACLYERLRVTLDHCCEVEEHIMIVEHTVIQREAPRRGETH